MHWETTLEPIRSVVREGKQANFEGEEESRFRNLFPTVRTLSRVLIHAFQRCTRTCKPARNFSRT